MTKIDTTARRAALTAFDSVSRKGRALDGALEQIDKSRMPDCDRAFARRLVMDLLRRRGQIDAVLARHLSRPVPPKHAYVTDVLRLTALQILYTGTPAHAAVSTGVELAKQYKKGAFAPLVNAVSRKICAGQPLTDDDCRLNFPEFLWRAWEKSYGKERARSIASAFLKQAPTDFSVKANPAQWAERLNGFVLPAGTVRVAQSVTVPTLDGYARGDWWVQDFSASLPAKMFSNVAGKSVLDVCAAPGGKTAQLCSFGADVTALDISAARMARLRENMERLGYAPETVVADFLQWRADNPEKRYDCILLDAPCSATGTLRRHPDVMYHRTREDIERLSRMQSDLLKAALGALKSGGELVYAVCSVLTQEGEAVVDGIEKQGLAKRFPVQNAAFPKEVLTPRGDVLVLPDMLSDIGGADGFYACRLIKGEG